MLPAWVQFLGGTGIIATLSGVTAVFVRLGRGLQRLDDIEARISRLEARMDAARDVATDRYRARKA